MKITDIKIAWRDQMLPASFRDAVFHVANARKEGGRRVAVHEFPKRESPYAEDMGRHAFRFSVRAYCITYPFNFKSPLLMHDYRIARDLLQTRLDDGIPGSLQLPTLKATGAGTASSMPMPITVVCERYSLTEEERFGGYCVFDIEFCELGIAPNQPLNDTLSQLIQASRSFASQTVQNTLANIL